MLYDTAILGSGVAGISAALTLKNLNKTFILLGSRDLSLKIQKAERINNFVGLKKVSGEELYKTLKDQLESENIAVTKKNVIGIYNLGDKFGLATESEIFEAKTVIIATGSVIKPGIEGEAEFLGRGVSYCAPCDGGLYRGKTVAVICYDEELLSEVTLLSGIAKTVKLIPLYKEAKAGTFSPNVEIINDIPVKISGGMKAGEVICKNSAVSADGIFILKKAYPATSLVKGLKTEDGHIFINRETETNIPGCFAAGDCTGAPYQYAKAIGEGNVAAFSAADYINKNK